MGNSDHSYPRRQARDLADGRRAAVAGVRPRRDQGHAARDFSMRRRASCGPTIDAWSGGEPGPWTRDTTSRVVHRRHRSPERSTRSTRTGLLYTRACGGWRVDPLKAELGPRRGTRRGRLDGALGAASASRAARLADRVLLGQVVVGWIADRGVPEAEARAREGQGRSRPRNHHPVVAAPARKPSPKP